jgi:hypothetical protein
MQALTYVARIGGLSYETCSEVAKKRQCIFPGRVDERDFRNIDNQPHSCAVARHQRASVLCFLADQAALKLEAQSVRGIVYFDA